MKDAARLYIFILVWMLGFPSSYIQAVCSVASLRRDNVTVDPFHILTMNCLDASEHFSHPNTLQTFSICDAD